MTSHLNKTSIIGRIGRDASVTPVGQSSLAINFSICVNAQYKDREGQPQTKSTWFECTIWRKVGSSTEITKALKAGIEIYAEGEIDARVTEKDGAAPQACLMLRISNLVLVGNRQPLSLRDNTADE